MAHSSKLKGASEGRINPPLLEENLLTTPTAQYHESPRTYVYRQHLAAILANIPSFNMGVSMAWSAAAVPVLLGQKEDEQPLRLTLAQASWVGSMTPLASLAGALVAGPLAERLGRKGALLVSAAPSIVGCLLISFAGASFWQLLAGRVLTGAATGAINAPAALYCEEIAEVGVRGALGSYLYLQASMGTVFGYGLGGALPYVWFNAFTLVPSIFFLGTFCWMPESPAFLAARGRHHAARRALAYFKGPRTDYALEMQSLTRPQAAPTDLDAPPNTSFFSVWSRRPWRSTALRSTALMLAFMFLQQMSGIALFTFYTVQIFEEMDGSIPSHLASVIWGLGNVLAVFLTFVTVDRLGRRILLLASSTLMGVCLVILLIYTQCSVNKYDLEGWKWIPVVTLLIFGTMYSVGPGPVSWFLMAELIPMYAKGWACPAVVCMNRLSMFLVAKEGLYLLEYAGQTATYSLFAVSCFITTAFVIFFVPETKGKTKMDILKEVGGVDP